MPGLKFDKRELGNLEYSLQREMLATDRRGGYMSTTIVGCNTRKYHGLIVAPIDSSNNAYVLLSSLDETIVQHDQSFNLALHRFRGVYEPRGHKYITDFEYTPCPTITYRVGGVILRKEILWIHKRTQMMIRYTLVDAHSETTLRLRPFLAFRNRHELSKANMYANVRSYPVTNGVKNRLYDGFPWLHMQLSKADAKFIPAGTRFTGWKVSTTALTGTINISKSHSAGDSYTTSWTHTDTLYVYAVYSRITYTVNVYGPGISVDDFYLTNKVNNSSYYSKRATNAAMSAGSNFDYSFAVAGYTLAGYYYSTSALSSGTVLSSYAFVTTPFASVSTDESNVV